MIEEVFVFDTYALIEIIGGNEKYKNYLDKKIIINEFIYAELCYILIRNKYPNLDKYLEIYKQFIVNSSPEVIKKSMEFRYKNKEKRVSMTDCISYFMSIEMNVKFLTGDKEFENLDNVEFVKK